MELIFALVVGSIIFAAWLFLGVHCQRIISGNGFYIVSALFLDLGTSR